MGAKAKRGAANKQIKRIIKRSVGNLSKKVDDLSGQVHGLRILVEHGQHGRSAIAESLDLFRDEMHSKLTELEERLAGRIGNVEAAVLENGSAIGELRSDLSELRSDLSELRSDLSKLQTEVGSISGKLDVGMIDQNETRRRIEILEQRVDDFSDG